MSSRETLSNSIDLVVIDEYNKGAMMQMSTVIWQVYHIACRSILWNWTYLTTFSENVTSKIQNL